MAYPSYGEQVSAPVRSRVWRHGRVEEVDLSQADLDARVRDPDCVVWVDLADPDPATLAHLGHEIGMSSASIEDALAPLERPKVSRHPDGIAFVAYATDLGGPALDGDVTHGRLRMRRISGFVTPTALVTVRPADFPIDGVIERWDSDPELLEHGVGALLYGLLDALVDGHFATIQQLDDAIEGIEDALFDDTPGHTLVRDLYGIRKDLVRLRRVVLPMREVVNALLRHRTTGDIELDAWYDDLYDHVLRAAEWTESLRDMVTTVFETNLSLQDRRLNVVMKQLAGWAAIIAVPTAITGWFGQNVPYLGFGKPIGVWMSVIAIVLSSSALYLIFRRRDWL